MILNLISTFYFVRFTCHDTLFYKNQSVMYLAMKHVAVKDYFYFYFAMGEPPSEQPKMEKLEDVTGVPCSATVARDLPTTDEIVGVKGSWRGWIWHQWMWNNQKLKTNAE